jgi:hypothetical protein
VTVVGGGLCTFSLWRVVQSFRSWHFQSFHLFCIVGLSIGDFVVCVLLSCLISACLLAGLLLAYLCCATLQYNLCASADGYELQV